MTEQEYMRHVIERRIERLERELDEAREELRVFDEKELTDEQLGRFWDNANYSNPAIDPLAYNQKGETL